MQISHMKYYDVPAIDYLYRNSKLMLRNERKRIKGK